MKKISLIIFLILLSANICFAITLLTENEALDRLLGQTGQVTPQKIAASEVQLAEIKKELGGNVEQLNHQRDFIFYLAKKENKSIGVAIILDEPGKWGPIKFIITLSPEGEIRDAAVMKYTETRGRPVASRDFLRQFFY